MIPVAWYSTVYHIVIALIIIALCNRLILYNSKNFDNKSINQYWCNLLLLISILFIGLRNPYASFIYFGDTGAYTRIFQSIQEINIFEQNDIGFYIFMKLCSYFLNINLFYLLCAFLYVYPVYVIFKKWFANLALYALAIYIVSMSFWAFGINGVRNGLAVSFFIFSLGFINKKWLIVLIMLISIIFHKSMLLPIVAFFVSYFLKKTNLLITGWIGCIILSYLFGERTLTIIQPLLDSLNDTRANIYSYESVELSEFMKGFRFDFVLYSTFPIILGWYYKNKKKYTNRFYDQLLNMYILTNSVWVLFFMYAPFADRYAYLSWFIMPVIMIYPLLKEKLLKRQIQFISYLLIGSLVFTLIMFFR